MAIKQVAFRLEEGEHGSLKLRATIEKRSMNEIISDAIQEYSRNHPISREDALAIVRAIATEDADLLKALAEAQVNFPRGAVSHRG